MVQRLDTKELSEQVIHWGTASYMSDTYTSLSYAARLWDPDLRLLQAPGDSEAEMRPKLTRPDLSITLDTVVGVL